MIFHIGPEIVECLMRKSNSSETKRECPHTQIDTQIAARKTRETRLQRSPAARTRWSVDKVASALLLALRWLL